MKILVPLICLVLASASWAEDPAKSALQVSVQALVQRELLKPLASYEANRSRFSRAAMPPAARRVRVQDGARTVDSRGRAFTSFAVDTRRGFGEEDAHWVTDAMVGCAYLDDGAVWVKRNDVYRAASTLAGKKAPDPPAGVCLAGVDPVAAAASSAQRPTLAPL